MSNSKHKVICVQMLDVIESFENETVPHCMEEMRVAANNFIAMNRFNCETFRETDNAFLVEVLQIPIHVDLKPCLQISTGFRCWELIGESFGRV